jgi:hypothetical protein
MLKCRPEWCGIFVPLNSHAQTHTPISLTVKSTVFWKITPCILVEVCQNFGNAPIRSSRRNISSSTLNMGTAHSFEKSNVAPWSLPEVYWRFWGTCFIDFHDKYRNSSETSEVTLCNLVYAYRRFWGTCFLHFLGRRVGTYCLTSSG